MRICLSLRVRASFFKSSLFDSHQLYVTMSHSEEILTPEAFTLKLDAKAAIQHEVVPTRYGVLLNVWVPFDDAHHAYFGNPLCDYKTVAFRRLVTDNEPIWKHQVLFLEVIAMAGGPPMATHVDTSSDDSWL